MSKSVTKAILIPQDVATADLHEAIDDHIANEWLTNRRKLTKPEATAELVFLGRKYLAACKVK